MNQPLLQMSGVRKTFGPVIALDNVDLRVERNEIHGLLGGNGAGKTTLMNILYGLYKPDAGTIEFEGERIEINTPRDAIRQGIGMVHQHFLQVDAFNVVQNIVLGTALQNRPALDLSQADRKIKALAGHFGLDVAPRAMMAALPMGARQKVEILKALYREARILILDEPTTNLTPQEVDSLFQSLRVMVDEGMSVVFITHKLREVLSVCDQITVLREGQSVLTLRRSDASEEAFVKAMVGDEVDVANSLLFSAEEVSLTRPALDRRPILQVKELEVAGDEGGPALDRCSFEIYPQEILGMAGVAGNGQQALAESLIGRRTITGGRVLLDELDVATTPTVDLLTGLAAYIPENRLQDGFLPAANVAQNLILGFHRRAPYYRRGFLNWRTIYRAARRLIAEYNIRTPGPEDIAANLSGGNIQRVMIARAFSYPARLLVAHNPTQGLDIPSIEFVYTKFLARKEQGQATLLISEDLEELMLLCDRIAVLYRGRLAGVLERQAFDKYEIGRLMSGLRDHP